MFQEDRLMREISQIHLVFAKIFKLSQQKKYGEAEEIIEIALKNLSGINLQLIGLFDTKALLAMMAGYDHTIVEDQNKLLSISNLIFEKAKIYCEKGDDEKRGIFLTRALEVLIYCGKLPHVSPQVSLQVSAQDYSKEEFSLDIGELLKEQIDAAQKYSVEASLIEEAKTLLNLLPSF